MLSSQARRIRHLCTSIISMKTLFLLMAVLLVGGGIMSAIPKRAAALMSGGYDYAWVDYVSLKDTRQIWAPDLSQLNRHTCSVAGFEVWQGTNPTTGGHRVWLLGTVDEYSPDSNFKNMFDCMQATIIEITTGHAETSIAYKDTRAEDRTIIARNEDAYVLAFPHSDSPLASDGPWKFELQIEYPADSPKGGIAVKIQNETSLTGALLDVGELAVTSALLMPLGALGELGEGLKILAELGIKFGEDHFEGSSGDAWGQTWNWVPGPNRAPTAYDDNWFMTLKNTSIDIPDSALLQNDSDLDKNALSVRAAAGGPQAQNGTVYTGTMSGCTYKFVPNMGFTGMASFKYRAFDGQAYSNDATVYITVYSVNSPPTARADDYTLRVTAGGTYGFGSVLNNDWDPDGDRLMAILGTGPGNLSLSSNGTFTLTIASGFSGAVTFTYKANDGKADSSFASVTIRVMTVLKPVAANHEYTITQGGTLTVSAPGLLTGCYDPGGVPIEVYGHGELHSVPYQFPQHGTLQGFGPTGAFTYTPNANFTGTDYWYYEVRQTTVDGAGSDPACVAIHVVPVNYPPQASDDFYKVNQGSVLDISAPTVLANDRDPNGDSLTAILVSGTSNGVVTLDSSDGSFSYTPNVAFSGTDHFKYKARDVGGSESAVATVTIQVRSTPLAPRGGSDYYYVEQGTTLGLDAPGVLANDADPNGDPLTARLAANPTHGTVALSTDGSFTYTPEAGFNGTDEWYYVASGGGDSAPVRVSMSVYSGQQPDELVLDMPLNEGTGNVAHDYSGDAHNGSIAGTISWTADGLVFGKNAARITIPAAADLKCLNGFRVEAEVKPTAFGPDDRRFIICSYYRHPWGATMNWGRLEAGMYWPNNSNTWTYSSAALCTQNAFQRIAIQYSAATGKIQYYINGSLVDEKTLSGKAGVPLKDESRNIYIGFPGDNGYNHFEGIIRDLKVFALSAGSGGGSNVPAAAFSATPAADPPLAVNFTDQSTSSQGIISRSWSFGDGDTSTETNPSHQYSGAGTYTVTLTVTEADGDTDTVAQDVTVNAADSTLLLDMPLNEGSGSTATYTLSGQSMTAPISGSVTWDTSGLLFGGSKAHINVPASAELECRDGFIIEAQIRPTTLGSGGNSQTNPNYVVASYYRQPWGVLVDNSQLGAGLTWQDSSFQYPKSSAATVSLNTWQTIALKYSVDTGMLEYYVGGSLVDTQDLGKQGIMLADLLNTISVGYSGDVGWRHFEGYIRNLKIMTLSEGGSTTLPTPVAQWSMNEGSGTTAADSVGGNTGYIENGSWTTSGKLGNALVFNGNTTVVNCGNGSSLQFLASGSYTWAAWVYYNGLDGEQHYIIEKGSWPDSGYTFMTLDNKLHFLNDYADWGIAGGTTLQIGQWYHVACTYNNGDVVLYLNGVQDGSGSPGTFVSDTTNDFCIGTYWEGHTHNGRMDEVALYNVALTAAQIQQLYISQA